jgi:uncharacterized membrane protein YbhN (UPF0104 family)
MASVGKPLARRLLGWLRVLVTVGILVWVGSRLPWSDELLYHDAAGHRHALAGRIDGDWKGDLVRFLPEEGAQLDAAWPQVARTAAAAGEPILARRDGEEGGYDWNPGMPRAFRDMDPGGLVLAQVCFLVAMLTICTRWWRLLCLAGCPTSWWNATRLTFLGLFFNNVMPGQTGGDLVKGVIVAKENPDRKAEALVTVLVDRIFGLIALAILALVVALFVAGPLERLRLPLAGGLGAALVGAALYSSKRVRRATGLSALVDRLPMGDKLRSVDRAAMLYLRQPVSVAVAFVFSFVNHFLVTLGVFFLGQALGVPGLSLFEYLVLVPVANLISAVPLAPGGWGVGELAFRSLFEMVGASAALGVAVSVTFRLSQLGLGLVGGLFLLFPGSRTELREARAEEEPAVDSPDRGP